MKNSLSFCDKLMAFAIISVVSWNIYYFSISRPAEVAEKKRVVDELMYVQKRSFELVAENFKEPLGVLGERLHTSVMECAERAAAGNAHNPLAEKKEFLMCSFIYADSMDLDPKVRTNLLELKAIQIGS